MKGHRAPGRGRADPGVPSVASLFISRWDVAVADQAPAELRNKLGIAVGRRPIAPTASCSIRRWQRLENEGARPQRLLFASTGTKDPEASDTLYIEALAAPLTINTMPEKTLNASPTTARWGTRCRRTAAPQLAQPRLEVGVHVSAGLVSGECGIWA